MPGPDPDALSGPRAAGSRGGRFTLRTFGCRCNQADSGGIREQLVRRGFDEVERADQADWIVVNSCTVTARTDRDIRQALRGLHRRHPGARLVVTGCYAERDPETLVRIAGVELVVGNADRDRLGDLLAAPVAADSAARIEHAPLEAVREAPLLPGAGRAEERTRPFVKIQDGCDARCAYCVVPFVRGPARSAPAAAVVAQIERLIGAGHQEIVLTGVNLGSYGAHGGEPDLAELLRRILALPGLGRLRLSSVEPMRFAKEIVDLAAEEPKLARHFHLPLQSGSDSILRRMRRPYRAGALVDLLAEIAARLPGVGLGTDVIVGFPGESERDFEATLECLAAAPIAYAHVFPYSPRPETDAWRLPHPVPPRVVRDRAARVRALARRKNLEFRSRFLGSVLGGVTLGSDESPGAGTVLTDNYVHVSTPGCGPAPNRLVRVRVDRVEADATLGTLLA